MNDVGRIEVGDPKRWLEAILFYNETKEGVDTADEMLRGYSTKAASRRWPLAAFFNLLYKVCFNAYVICKDVGIENVSRKDAFFFSWEKHCVMLNVKDKNPQYSDYQQRLEIILVILSFQRKSEHPVVVAKKTKHL